MVKRITKRVDRKTARKKVRELNVNREINHYLRSRFHVMSI